MILYNLMVRARTKLNWNVDRLLKRQCLMHMVADALKECVQMMSP